MQSGLGGSGASACRQGHQPDHGIEQLKEKNIWVVAADAEAPAADTVNMTGAIALVIGAEGEGISRLVLEACDLKASIPMKGKTGSLNAAVAAAVLMYEKVRQDVAKKR